MFASDRLPRALQRPSRQSFVPQLSKFPAFQGQPTPCSASQVVLPPGPLDCFDLALVSHEHRLGAVLVQGSIILVELLISDLLQIEELRKRQLGSIHFEQHRINHLNLAFVDCTIDQPFRWELQQLRHLALVIYS